MYVCIYIYTYTHTYSIWEHSLCIDVGVLFRNICWTTLNSICSASPLCHVSIIHLISGKLCMYKYDRISKRMKKAYLMCRRLVLVCLWSFLSPCCHPNSCVHAHAPTPSHKSLCLNPSCLPSLISQALCTVVMNTRALPTIQEPLKIKVKTMSVICHQQTSWMVAEIHNVQYFFCLKFQGDEPCVFTCLVGHSFYHFSSQVTLCSIYTVLTHPHHNAVQNCVWIQVNKKH